MKRPWQMGFWLAATVLNGILGGAGVVRAAVEIPAWRRVGALAWAEFSRNAALAERGFAGGGPPRSGKGEVVVANHRLNDTFPRGTLGGMIADIGRSDDDLERLRLR